MKIHIGNEHQDTEMREFILKQIQIEDIKDQERRATRAAMLKSLYIDGMHRDQIQNKKVGFNKPLTSKITC